MSAVQRRFRVGYSRAGRIIDALERKGVVGPYEGSKSRAVVASQVDLESMFGDDGDPEYERRSGRPIWPRVGSFYGRLLGAMEDGPHTHNLAPDGSNGGANGEAKIGPILEQKRKERGLSLEEVEQATKIRKRYLAGLEREDYAVLPDAVYAQGFLKTYANYSRPRRGGPLPAAQEPQEAAARARHRLRHQPESDFEEPLISPRRPAGHARSAVPALGHLYARSSPCSFWPR